MTVDDLDAAVLVFIRSRIDDMGEEASGAHGYYAYRVERDLGLMPYERDLYAHLRGDPRVFHPGLGLGTLTAGLAATGSACVGFEYDFHRHPGAVALGEAIAPGADYDVRMSVYPEGLKASDRTTEATLLFTNVGAGMDDAWQDRLIDTFGHFRRVILDLRLFGEERNEQAERDALLRKLTSRGLSVRPIPVGDELAHYVEILVPQPTPLLADIPVTVAEEPERPSRRPVSPLKRVRKWIARRYKA